MRWWMCNVVWYDGCDAFVSKVILKCELGGITEESEELLGQELNGNGELLKVDKLYPVDLDNIIALKDSDKDSDVTIYNRFKDMWF